MRQRDKREKIKKFLHEAQTMMEYLMMLAATVVVVLLAFRSLLPRTTEYSNIYFNKVSAGIMGNQAGCFYSPDGNMYYKARTLRRNYP